MSLQKKARRASLLVLLTQVLTFLAVDYWLGSALVSGRWLELLAALTLLCAPPLLLYCWFLQRKVLAPLSQLTQGIQNIDLSTDHWNRLYFQSGDGEVAQVSQAVNQLIDRLAYYRGTMVDEGLRYKALLEQSTESIFTVNPVSGRIIQANPSFAAFVGRENVIDSFLWDVFQSQREVLEQHAKAILEKGSLVLPSVTLRLWDGSWRNVEIRCSLILYNGQELVLVSLSDMTEYHLFQEELRNDLARAEQLQRNFLPPDLDNDLLQIRCIFHSCTGISGDFYDYFWDPRERRLKGFLLDVCGHGVATGMQASLTAAFLWYAVHLPGSLGQKLRWVNEKALRYYPEDSFATVFYFEVDLIGKKLHYVTGGVNYFLAYCAGERKIVETASSLVGVDQKPLFKQQSFEIKAGDCFYFTTDGLFDAYPRCEEIGLDHFSDVVRFLKKTALQPVCRDDASAICLRICMPQDGKRWAVLTKLLDLTLNSLDDFADAVEEIAVCLREIMKSDGVSLFEIAVHEAINNALLNGRDKAGRLEVRLTIYLLHATTLVVEVRDGGPGFPAQMILRQLSRLGQAAFDSGALSDCGRGISIMLLAADSLSYNRKGTRVRLLKDIVRQGR
ncbi:SpoIIE family protein phosphatase [Azotosporobacter soli]|uniref:SpoIIE family protein phosphatase n=1 Tax=Azotosporobacter soli TaxID=3055040 RepID=UPI0031FE9258